MRYGYVTKACFCHIMHVQKAVSKGLLIDQNYGHKNKFDASLDQTLLFKSKSK